MVDYYQALGLNRNCTTDDVKKAYKIYAKKFHPDLHLNDIFFKERFQEVLSAYETLIDNQKRSRYDKIFFDDKFSDSKTSSSSKTEQFINDQLRKQLAEEQEKVHNLRTVLNQEREKIGILTTEHEEIKRKYIILENKAKRVNYAKKIIKSITSNLNSLRILISRNKLRLYTAAAIILSLCFSYILFKPKPPELVIGTEYYKLRAFATQGQWTKIIQRVDSSLHSGSVVDTSKSCIYGTTKNYKSLEKADLIFMRAYAKQVIQNDTGATKDYNEAIRIRKKPDSWDYTYRGQLMKKLDNRAEAYEDFNQSLSINPANTQSRNFRYHMLIDDRRFDEALSDARVLQRTFPNDTTALLMLGNCFDDTSKKDSACIVWGRAIELGSRLALFNKNLLCRYTSY